MQSVELIKCPSCGARINPSWPACISCNHPLGHGYERVNEESLDGIERILEALKMPISDFKKAHLLIRIRSRVLDAEEIFIASSDREAEIGRAEGLVCYTADEIAHIVASKSPLEDIKAIHAIKKELGGRLIAVQEKGG